MRGPKRILLLVAAILLLGIAAALFQLWRSVPPLAGTERVAGLGADVTIRWDSLAVPHIVAASDADAFRALGYLHARDRLWQMETLRRAAEGRLSEIFGAQTVESDRFLRTLDIARAARASVALMPPETRAILDAYVAGINAWIAHPTRPLPPEYWVLRTRPEPWTPEQVFAVERLESWDLAASTIELRMARIAAIVGPVPVQDLMPDYPGDGPVILQPGSYTYRRRSEGARERALHRSIAPSAFLSAADVPEIPAQAAAILDAVATTRASNSWVIGPRLSRSGKPILSNDPHLDLSAPAIWYLAAIESPSYHVVGATVPGCPPIVLGHNRRVAWGWTNLEADDVDYVIERLSPDSSRVLTTAGWVPVEVEHDTIRVRGGAGIPFTMRRTGHGPLVPRLAGQQARKDSMVEAVAMRWNGLDPTDDLTGALALDRAGNWTEFLAAARGLKVPEQNWIYADVDGNIGYTATGNIPVRRSGTGLLPTPGWTDEGRWERYLDFDELPHALNPPEGFIVTANNRTAGPEYPWLFTRDWAPPYRAMRIRQLLTERAQAHSRTDAQFSAQDMARMQMDTLDLFAVWAKEIAAAAADRIGFHDRAALLRAWDGTVGADRREPVLFYIWYRALQQMTTEDELGAPLVPSSRLHAWLRAGTSRWFDDVRTPQVEDLPQLADAAMRAAIPLAGTQTWGQVHATIARHAMGGLRPLDLLLRLNIGPFPRAGSLYTVNVGDFSAFTAPFTNTHAASLRHVVDMADPQHGLFVITSGQSGNPLSSRYRDQAHRWLRGEVAAVRLTSDSLLTTAVLRLVPSGR